MTFKDHFSHQSTAYGLYRPHYPRSLFVYLVSLVERHERAWDCGTGNGQAAVCLADYFDEVIATDASEQQIAHAIPHKQVSYRVRPAEDSGLEAGSVDLITVGQALHWFDLKRFYAEVRRVLRSEGMLAVWCYGLLRVSPPVNVVLEHFYREIVGPYWPPERKWIDKGYQGLEFPFSELETPCFQMESQWTLEHLLGYLGTWSAVQRYRAQEGSDPLEVIRDELTRAWGDPGHVQRVHWPLYLRAGRYH